MKLKAYRNKINVLGVPSSAGAYGPGQEKAPNALRDAGLIKKLIKNGFNVFDIGNTIGYRWRIDNKNKRAMNIDLVVNVIQHTSAFVRNLICDDSLTLVIGGDCTVGIGTVDGALGRCDSVGVIYIDLDTDLNTPHSTDDGALDWMGVAHMLAVDECEPLLVNSGKKVPLLYPEQIYHFGFENITTFEKNIFKKLNLIGSHLLEVKKNPRDAAFKCLKTWGKNFKILLIHLDLDILDFNDIQLAENYRRNRGLTLKELMNALSVFFNAPNLRAITLTEINPDHGNADGSTLTSFIDHFTNTLTEPLRYN